MCKVSVIVPVYNSERYLRTCLDTLATQSLDDIEVLVINDGSTDGSLAIIEEYIEKYSWFSVCSTENKGVSHARNYGISMSKGNFLAFVDSDDEVEPDYCKVMYEKAIRDDNDLVICQFDKVTMSNGEIKHLFTETPLFKADNFKMSDHRDYFSDISVGPWDKLIRRDLCVRLYFPEGVRYAEDQFFAAKAFCLAHNIGTVKKTLYHYFYDIHDGVTACFGEERLDWVKVMEYLYDFMKNDEMGSSFVTELEYFMVAKSIRLCSSVAVRTNLSRELRVRIVREIHCFLHENLPDWRRNPYYIEERMRAKQLRSSYYSYRMGKKVCLPYCSYRESYMIFLINLSNFLPNCLYHLILKVSQALLFLSYLVNRSDCVWDRKKSVN